MKNIIKIPAKKGFYTECNSCHMQHMIIMNKKDKDKLDITYQEGLYKLYGKYRNTIIAEINAEKLADVEYYEIKEYFDTLHISSGNIMELIIRHHYENGVSFTKNVFRISENFEKGEVFTGISDHLKCLHELLDKFAPDDLYIFDSSMVEDEYMRQKI